MLQFTNNKELKHFDLMTLGMAGVPVALLGATSTYPYNWMIVAGPTTQGRVNIIHHAFSVAESTNDDPKIVGVTGDRKTSALKPFNPAVATRTLNPKTTVTRTRSDKKIPSIQQFLVAPSPHDFQTLAGKEEEEPICTLDKLPNLLWIHKTVFSALEGKASMRAVDAAMQIIAQIKTNIATTGDDDEEEDDPDAVTTMQRDCHLLLTFLWAVANGFGQNIPLTDPPDTPIFHAKGQQLMDEIYGLPATMARAATGTPVPAAGAPPSGSLIDALLPALVQNLSASTTMFLKTADREAQKNDILSKLATDSATLFAVLSKLATDSATLFAVLSAGHWRDTAPVLNHFTAQLVQDRDAASSISQVMSTTRTWNGLVSAKGLAKFLAVGYGAPDIDQQPGGFSIFMFWPRHVSGTQSSTTTTEQTIKSLFGDGKLSDEAVKYYSKSELYLTNDVDLFDIQLSTCIAFLDLLTARRGIASDGYRRGYTIFRGNKGRICDLCRADKLFCVKFGYFLDRVFRSFIMELMKHFDSHRPPIREARRALNGKQAEMVNDGL
jgi:hypothetical protein